MLGVFCIDVKGVPYDVLTHVLLGLYVHVYGL